MMVNWAQVLFNSAVTGSLYLIGAVGLTLTYGLSGFPNFAYAEFITLGGYMGYLVARQLGLGFPLAFVAAFLASGILGALAYRGVFRFLANRGANKIHLMVASIGLGFVIRHIIGDIWGHPAVTLGISWSAFNVGPLRVTNLWLGLIATALVVALIMHLLLTRTKTGKAIRGISTNPELALASGISIERVTLVTWAGGAALAGVAGLFWAAMAALSPLLGWARILPVFAVTILGGIGSFYGAFAAAFIIGLAENIGVVALTQFGISTEYRMAIAFIILIITLIVRPQGLARAFRRA
jgi:branched-subunit amino acid ABC-type transport system permease component